MGKRNKVNRSGRGGKKNSGDQANKKKKAVEGDGSNPSEVVLTRFLKKGRASERKLPLVGLMNLGNTCFFNAVMQNLAQTQFLRRQLSQRLATESYHMELVMEEPALPTLSLEVILSPESVAFTKMLSTFLEQMNGGGCAVLNPRPVFSHVCNSAPRFRGFQQQDSQELLRCLLEAVKNEEVHCIKRAILKHLNIHVAREREKISEQERKNIRMYGVQAGLSRTVVDNVFGGKLLSTVTCQECLTCSRRTEDFLDLSLSIPAEKCPKGKAPAQLATQEDYRGNTSYCDNRHASTSTEDGTERDSPFPAKSMSKHQKKKLRKEERRKKKIAKFSLVDLEEKASELEKKQVASPTSKSSKDLCEASGDEEEEEMEEAKSAQDVPQDTGTLEAKEKINSEASAGEVEGGSSDIEVMPVVVKDSSVVTETNRIVVETNCVVAEDDGVVVEGDESSKLQVDEVEGPKVMKDLLLHEQAADVDNGSPKQSKDLADSLAKLRLTNTDHNISNSDKNQTSHPADYSSPNPEPAKPSLLAAKGEQSSEGLPSTHSHPQLLCFVPNPFSIEACLYRFCMPEVLDGEDKIYCEKCTDRLRDNSQMPAKCPPDLKLGLSGDSSSQLDRSGQSAVLEHQTGRSCVQGDGCGGDNADSESTCERCPVESMSSTDNVTCNHGNDTLRRNHGDDSPPESSGTVEDRKHLESLRCDSESLFVQQLEDVHLSSRTEKDDDSRENDPDDESEEDGQRSDARSSASTDEPQAVFCEGIKQMSIDRPPPVLCLHLKRFSQQGRTLRSVRKNSHHVQFPPVLDLAPFCTTNSKDLLDSSGCLLYALYGVVEHSGSMQSGHYVAWVRVPTHQVTSATATGQDFSSDTAHGNKTESRLLECPTVSSVDTAKSSDRDVCGREFDLSTCPGQWFYVSDANVKKSTEADVLKSQAYILFYERIPFV